jgi:molybdopterin-guanine dinucleotide biosynthesis protein A
MPGMSDKVTGFILAGGQSRRMGSEKPLLEVGGTPLVERVARAVAPCVAELVVVTNRPELYGFLGRPTIPDTWTGRGPLGGIHAALKHLRGSAALIVAGDYPFLAEAAIARLAREKPGGGVVLPRIEGMLHPLCAVYGSGALGAVEEALGAGELMVRSFVERLHDRKFLDETEFGGREAAGRIFMNVNTPDDLRRAEELLAGAQPR